MAKNMTTQNQSSVFFQRGGCLSMMAVVTARWLFEHGGCCYGAVVTNKDGPILIFFCGFCKRDDGDSLYGDDASKDCL
jgi:hypothetical protein